MRLEITGDPTWRHGRWSSSARLGRRTKSAELAEAIGTTPGFLSQAMTPLAARGWVQSEPGTLRWLPPHRRLGRGECVGRDRGDGKEGPSEGGRCVLEDRVCGDSAPSALHQPWTRARTQLLDELSNSPTGLLGTGAPIAIPAPTPAAPTIMVTGSGRTHPALCNGCGNCHRSAPRVYVLDDEGYIGFHLMDVPPELAVEARLGAQVCPNTPSPSSKRVSPPSPPAFRPAALTDQELDVMNISQDLRLAEIVDLVPGAPRVLESFGLDYCCGGQKTLRGSRPQGDGPRSIVVVAIEALEAGPVPDWVSMSPQLLVNHIESTHRVPACRTASPGGTRREGCRRPRGPASGTARGASGCHGAQGGHGAAPDEGGAGAVPHDP